MNGPKTMTNGVRQPVGFTLPDAFTIRDEACWHPRISVLCGMASTQKLVASPVYQLLLWAAAVLGIFFIRYGFALPTDGASALLQIIAGILPLAAAVYVNHYLLIPRLLHAQRPGWYWASLAALVIFVSLIDWFYPYFPFPQASPAALGGLHALLLLAAMSLYLSRKVSFQKQREFELLLRQSEMEMQLLRSQMNPHFLFNALNSIYSYALEGSERAAELIIQLSQLSRYQLESSRKRMLPLADELEFLHDFLSLEETRYSERCTIDFQINGDDENRNVPPMLLIPFVENAFKHGVATTNEPSFVNIRIDIAQNRLQMVVLNSIPQKPTRTVSSTWTGLANTRKRLQLVYPGRHYLDIVRQPTTYQVTLFINL
ncbi:MAG: histidine kinase [Tunicatimonas sp.]